MPETIKLYYHDGYYNKKKPWEMIANLARFGTLHHPVYNIGDQISPVVVAALSGRPVKHVLAFRKPKLIAIGSVLAGIKKGDTAWGSGLMKAEHVKYVKNIPNIRIKAVRGPETHKVLNDNGVDCPAVFGDPGLLMPQIYQPKIEKRCRVGIIPHITQVEYFRQIITNTEAEIISPRDHWRSFIDQILACDVIVSSSLHGVILADAYGVPAVPMKHGEFLHGSSFKFDDYYRSTAREASFIDSSQALNMAEVESRLAELKGFDINLRPLIDAFPYLDESESFVDRAKAYA